MRKNSYTGCLVMTLLCFSFVVGGMLGGILGGGLILWATAPDRTVPTFVAQVTPTDISTPVPTVTPNPQPQQTPTPTRVIEPTPSTADVVESILPSVVTVINLQNGYGQFAASDQNRRVVGSGIVVSELGYIMTNAHVVDSAEKLSVVLSNGEEVSAGLITIEPNQDLAMLKIEANALSPAVWGNSNEVRLGQPVMAVGSALGDFPNSVTMGIVSGLNRALALDEIVVYGLIQTDAAINQGNSGGPLVNTNGEVVGINTFIIRQDHDQGIAQGIGFAIPASSAKMLAQSWMAQDINALPPVNAQEMALPTPALLPASLPLNE